MGGLVGALVGMGIPEYEAKRYEGRIKEGGILLSVHCDNSDWVGKAKNLLKETGATAIKDMGRVMAALKERYAGKLDFGKASGAVKKMLSRGG